MGKYIDAVCINGFPAIKTQNGYCIFESISEAEEFLESLSDICKQVTQKSVERLLAIAKSYHSRCEPQDPNHLCSESCECDCSDAANWADDGEFLRRFK